MTDVNTDLTLHAALPVAQWAALFAEWSEAGPAKRAARMALERQLEEVWRLLGGGQRYAPSIPHAPHVFPDRRIAEHNDWAEATGGEVLPERFRAECPCGWSSWYVASSGEAQSIGASHRLVALLVGDHPIANVSPIEPPAGHLSEETLAKAGLTRAFACTEHSVAPARRRCSRRPEETS